VKVGEHEQVARTLLGLERDRSICVRLGRNARHMLEERLTRSAALERWHGALRSASITQTPAR
jgi:hypothetical protein